MAKKILVVDDDDTIRSVAEAFLTGKGYKVKTAENGERALDLVESDPPDIVLLDVVMPGINGFEVCRRLKENKKTKNAAVIIVSGNIAEIDKGFDYGADDCLSKPPDWEKLAERIAEL